MMGPVTGIILYAMIWAVIFLAAVPVRIKTQGDLGKVEAGTHAGAPEIHHLKKKAWITTALATVIWAIVAGVIFSGALTVRDIDIFDRMGGGASVAQ